jgi:hypothetical protein
VWSTCQHEYTTLGTHLASTGRTHERGNSTSAAVTSNLAKQLLVLSVGLDRVVEILPSERSTAKVDLLVWLLELGREDLIEGVNNTLAASTARGTSRSTTNGKSLSRSGRGVLLVLLKDSTIEAGLDALNDGRSAALVNGRVRAVNGSLAKAARLLALEVRCAVLDLGCTRDGAGKFEGGPGALGSDTGIGRTPAAEGGKHARTKVCGSFSSTGHAAVAGDGTAVGAERFLSCQTGRASRRLGTADEATRLVAACLGDDLAHLRPVLLVHPLSTLTGCLLDVLAATALLEQKDVLGRAGSGHDLEHDHSNECRGDPESSDNSQVTPVVLDRQHKLLMQLRPPS